MPKTIMDMCKVETLQKENHIESRKLWEQVFSEDSEAFLDAYYRGKGSTNEIDVIRDETGEICSMIQWNPVELMVGKESLTVDYLVAVATRADMRRKGLMAQIMKAGLRKRKEQGMPFVFLTPANEAYYEPFGFVTVGQSYQCQLRDVIAKSNQYEVRILKEEEYDAAAQWVNGCLDKQYTLFATRSKRYFQVLQKELLSEDGEIAGVFCEGDLKGVFVYTMSGGLEIREPVCEEEELLKVYSAIKDFFEKTAEEGIIIGCSKDMKHAIISGKTMVHVLAPEKCEGIFSNVYLNEIV